MRKLILFVVIVVNVVAFTSCGSPPAPPTNITPTPTPAPTDPTPTPTPPTTDPTPTPTPHPPTDDTLRK